MHFRPATSEDIPIVADILSAAAVDLQVRGLALWSPSDIGVSVITPHVLGGLYHVGLEGGVAVGVFRLEAADPVFWPEMAAGSAVYLHKLAVHPARQGQGCAHRLLTHAVTLARDRGAGFLRLDCMGGRPKLRRVYEGFGFRHHSQIRLGGRAYDRFEITVDGHRAGPADAEAGRQGGSGA